MSKEITREALVEFMRGPSPITHEPMATKVAEEWAEKFLEEFGVVAWGYRAFFTNAHPARGIEAGELYEEFAGMRTREEAEEHVRLANQQEDELYGPGSADPHLHCTYSLVKRVTAKFREVGDV